MKQEVRVSSGGTGFIGLLTIVFVVAKIGGWLDWSWWLVFAPIWMPLTLAVLVIVIGFLVYLVAEVKK